MLPPPHHSNQGDSLKGAFQMTNINDLKNNIVMPNDGGTFPAAARTTTANGAAQDLVDSAGPCFALLNIGAVTGTTPTLDIKVQESDTSGGTYTDIPGATLPQQNASNKSLAMNFNRTKRFVRGVATIGGTTPSFTFSFQIFGQKKAN